MKPFIILLIPVILLLNCKRPDSERPEPKNTGTTPINGTVKERGTGIPIANVKLNLSESQPTYEEGPGYYFRLVDSTTTNDSGVYNFTWKMKSGVEYNISYLKEGYYKEPSMSYGGYNSDTTFDLLLSAPSWIKFSVVNTKKQYEGFRFQDWKWENVVWDFNLAIDTIIRQVPGDKEVEFYYYKYRKNEFDPTPYLVKFKVICPTRDTLIYKIDY